MHNMCKVNRCDSTNAYIYLNSQTNLTLLCMLAIYIELKNLLSIKNFTNRLQPSTWMIYFFSSVVAAFSCYPSFK